MNIGRSQFWVVIGLLLAVFILAVIALVVYFDFPPGGRNPSPTAALTLVPPGPSPSPIPPTPLPSPTAAPAGKIVLTCQISAQQYHDQICIVNADGSDYHRLTYADGAENYYPSFAPDGSSVVFASNRTGSYEIYEVNIDGTDLRQLTHGLGEVNAPAISPDGRSIVFVAIIGGRSRIWLMDRDGGNPHEVFSQPGADSADPTWSPDGSLILFASGSGTDKQLFTISPDGTGLHLVSAEFRTRGRSDWSPDGTLIASYAGSPWAWNMYLMNADGTGLRQVPAGGVALAPAFSPDSRWIVFTGYLDNPNNPDGCEIYILRLSDNRISRLTYNNYCDWQPRWGP